MKVYLQADTRLKKVVPIKNSSKAKKLAKGPLLIELKYCG